MLLRENHMPFFDSIKEHHDRIMKSTKGSEKLSFPQPLEALAESIVVTYESSLVNAVRTSAEFRLRPRAIREALEWYDFPDFGLKSQFRSLPQGMRHAFNYGDPSIP